MDRRSFVYVNPPSRRRSPSVRFALRVGVAGATLGLVWLMFSYAWAWVLVLVSAMAFVGLVSFIVFALWLEQYTRNYGPPRH